MWETQTTKPCTAYQVQSETAAGFTMSLRIHQEQYEYDHTIYHSQNCGKHDKINHTKIMSNKKLLFYRLQENKQHKTRWSTYPPKDSNVTWQDKDPPRLEVVILQIPMNAASKKYTAIPDGTTYHFNVLPFGIILFLKCDDERGY